MIEGTTTDETGSEWHYRAVSRNTALMWQTNGIYNEDHKLEYSRATVERNAERFSVWKLVLAAMDNYSMALIINTN